MRITEIRVTLLQDETFRGVASMTLENCFVVRGLKIIRDRRGRLFVAMPNRRKKDGSYQDVAHPITAHFRKQVEDQVLTEYTHLLETGQEREPEDIGGPTDADFADL